MCVLDFYIFFVGEFQDYFLFSLQREVEKIVAVAWNIFQPFLFGLIGAEVSVTSLRPETVGKIIR